ncbi:exo-alpha-sialidase [Candidatus Acetothermia bacterium]|nr:exo-alpha-sialidase [Candidatus Acetothermia bacterium]
MQKIWRALGSLALLSIVAIAASAQISSTPKNIRVNDPAQDSLAEDHTTQSEVSLAVFGQTVVVAYVDTGQFLPRINGQSSLAGISVSTDGGKTFQDKGRLTANASGWGLSDPVLTVDRRGNFYSVSNQRNAQGDPLMGVSKSSDGDQTFSVPVLIPGTGPSNSFYQDKPWIAVDDTGGPFDGNVYIAWTEFTPAGEERVLLSRSTDGGQIFSAPTISSATGPVSQIGTSLAVGPNGELRSQFRPQSRACLRCV